MAGSPDHSAYLPAAVVDLNTGSDTDSSCKNDTKMSSRVCSRDSSECDVAGMTEREMRAQRRRELNRLASERSRQKKKKHSEKISEELRRLEERNVELRRMADSLTGRLHVADRLLRIVSGAVGRGPQSGAAIAAASAASTQRESSTETFKTGRTTCREGLCEIPAAPVASVEGRRGSRSAPY